MQPASYDAPPTRRLLGTVGAWVLAHGHATLRIVSRPHVVPGKVPGLDFVPLSRESGKEEAPPGF